MFQHGILIFQHPTEPHPTIRLFIGSFVKFTPEFMLICHL
jgi:hypothetical protein